MAPQSVGHDLYHRCGQCGVIFLAMKHFRVVLRADIVIRVIRVLLCRVGRYAHAGMKNVIALPLTD